MQSWKRVLVGTVALAAIGSGANLAATASSSDASRQVKSPAGQTQIREAGDVRREDRRNDRREDRRDDRREPEARGREAEGETEHEVEAEHEIEAEHQSRGDDRGPSGHSGPSDDSGHHGEDETVA